VFYIIDFFVSDGCNMPTRNLSSYKTLVILPTLKKET